MSEEDWFAPYVAVCVEAGLMQGTGEGRFEPERILSDAECTLLALRLRRAILGLPLEFPAAPEGWGSFSLVGAEGEPLFDCWDTDGFYIDNKNFLTIWLPEEMVDPLVGQAGQLIINETDIWDGVFVPAQEGDGIDPYSSYEAGFQLLSPLDSALDDPMVSGYCPAADLISDGLTRARAITIAPSWLRDAVMEQEEAELSFSYLSYGESSTCRTAFLLTLEEVLPSELLQPERNEITSLPDIQIDAYLTYTQDDVAYTSGNIAAFYRAGILSGTDQYGTLNGEEPLTRAEAAAILARVLEPQLRLTFTLEEKPWEGPAYTLTPLGVDLTAWADNGSYTCWYDPEMAEDLSEYQILHLSPRSEGSVDYHRELVMDVWGNVISEPGEYSDVETFHSDGLARFSTGHWNTDTRYGVIDRTGKEILPPIYHSISLRGDGIITAQKNEGESFLLMDAQGAQFGSLPSWVSPSGRQEERCIYLDEETHLWGYVDMEGAIVVPAQYDWAGRYYEGLAAVVKNGKAGFLDLEGNVAIPLELDDWRNVNWYDFRNDGYEYFFDHGAAAVQQDGEWFLIDRTGRQISPRRYDFLSRRFLLGSVRYEDYDSDAREGFLTPQGEEHPAPSLTGAQFMAECGSYYLIYHELSGAYSYVDREGKPLLPQLFIQATPLVDGTALVLAEDGAFYRLELDQAEVKTGRALDI